MTVNNDNNNLTQLNNNNNYYYEEQKPLIVIPAESGSIAISDYTGTVKPSDIRWKNYNDNHFYDNRNKYILTTSTTVSPTGINDLSSREMDEYDENYQNDHQNHYNDDDYNRENNNDENENDNDNYNNQPNINTYMETAKNIWDIFTAINTAWSAISDKQQNDNQYNRNFHENLTESTTIYYQQHNNDNNTDLNDDIERLKRNTNYTNGNFYYNKIESNNNNNIDSSTELAISEGRYIKGDPLKGYYDFVITEGSYKFWAAFQFATAILIIYSTFAAIYYSKVNPLVGDYDYVDYLGGGRSLSNNNNDDDIDFIDIPYSESRPKSSLLSSSLNDNNKNSKTFLSTIVETAGNSGKWLPRMGHTLKFILDAIDKIPQ